MISVTATAVYNPFLSIPHVSLARGLVSHGATCCSRYREKGILCFMSRKRPKRVAPCETSPQASGTWGTRNVKFSSYGSSDRAITRYRQKSKVTVTYYVKV